MRRTDLLWSAVARTLILAGVLTMLTGCPFDKQPNPKVSAGAAGVLEQLAP